ncbi:MAG: glucose-6-phosphate dehydrogenase [Candidatus Levybacteria bacterium RIFCSPHIGHO2_12_FULL_38_12]|nr:MAG: glucose-6-phosphate dehydrogenase [Candidatus Levybacteria bacterium RIFCSPHIGHO2_01_FULL_38_12]OGH22142.1 MAG: glucose-6-phosphate dehydrogenase [Candidatus Levybacteria bacterium RIFCSPHIGHO2_02_FULL_37_18]OGH22989.1 MAG: glucose-6-phosphate dehydrogenase [Candidatus Levybacteria bacterium RIFCSPHIGHO2_12_FULL_38_12]OGH44953.1 MAG: glucose-6-phosphate dehydrogenase [Candidatus Levybacteria bacterium RIFCSPLOWO2_02_FULL_37_18]
MNSSFVIIIFGATGDLAKNKLTPALFSLYRQNQLGQEFYIVGFARRDFTNEAFRELMRKSIHSNNTYYQSEWKKFSQNLYYQRGLFDEQQGYQQLIQKLHTFDAKVGACITRVFYLATPPDNYETILNYLSSTKLSEGCSQGSAKWTRLAIEKPFGKDLETARNLDKKLAEIFEEKQIFRVDHYLGKETVQNMIAFRFANGIFEPVWNKEHIDHVQIIWGEKKGISGRGKFFDGVGLLRDVAQNHLMQLVAAVAMEQPRSFEKEAIRDERFNAIEAIRCIKPEEVGKLVVRAQYKGYLEEKDVDPNFVTETFVALKLCVDTPRFEGVPFYLRAGKNVDKNEVKISIVFKQTCHILFKEYGCPEEGNVLTIHIQPDEGIGMRVVAKVPGSTLSLKTVDMKFTYASEFGTKGSDAYEKILQDILHGDQMLFNRSDELESSWEFINQILLGWHKSSQKPLIYEPGTWGPKEALDLIERDGKKWL